MFATHCTSCLCCLPCHLILETIDGEVAQIMDFYNRLSRHSRSCIHLCYCLHILSHFHEDNALKPTSATLVNKREHTLNGDKNTQYIKVRRLAFINNQDGLITLTFLAYSYSNRLISIASYNYPSTFSCSK